jgi:hypothetical protein
MTPEINQGTHTLDEIRALEARAESLATPAQLERMAEPESREIELLTIVRAQLFKPFGEFRKRVRLRSAAIAHAEHCQDEHDIAWSTTPCADGRPTPAAIATLTRMILVADGAAMHPWLAERVAEGPRCLKVRLEARIHRGVCRGCKAETSEQSVLVTIPWAGRVLSREYVL